MTILLPRARHALVLFVLAVFAASWGACAPATEAGPPGPRPTSPEAWVDAAVRDLSLRDKVAQMVMPWLDGSYMALGSPDHESLRRWVQDQKVGGLVVSLGAPLELAAKLNALQRMADLPLLVAADMEHGPGQRLFGGTIEPYGFEVGRGTQFPPVMGIGATGDESLAYELGRITALEARAAGVHMAFAPVVDVNNNPDNPIINTRSYGEDPALVARMAAAHVRGLQEHGMLATVKHFPGHGDTGTDSHIELPVIGVTKARADSVELVPYRATVDAGVAAVMTAHIAFPALTGDSVPATLHSELATGLLGEELGFRGIVVTDALNMGGIVRGFGPEEATVLAVEAGADILLMPPEVSTAIDAVVSAVHAGRISEARIDRSVRKLLTAKAGLGLHQRRTVDIERMAEVVGIPGHWDVARRAAQRSITVARDRERLLPLRRDARVLSVVYSDDPAATGSGTTLHRALRAAIPGIETIVLDDRSLAVLEDSLVAAAARADVVLFSPFVRVRAWSGRLAIHEDAARFVEWLASGGKPVIVASFGNPYLLSLFPQIGTYVLAWGQTEVVQEAAARALLGEVEITGRLPISIPPYHAVGEGVRVPRAVSGMHRERPPSLRSARPAEVGMDSARLARVDALIRSAIADSAAPGMALAVGRHGRIVRLQGFGRNDWRADASAVTDSTIWDLASLSKVIGTTTAVMMLVDAGAIDLEAPIRRYLPEWPATGEKGRITVGNLLLHNAGLEAFGPLYDQERGREEYLRAVAALPLEYTPGTRTLYSDWGIILTGMIVESASDMSLDRFLRERVFAPLGMRDTEFSPLQLRYTEEPRPRDPAAEYAALRARAAADPDGRALLARIPPTEVERRFRNAHVHGVVHDENAFALGGVAGHAGLFSSARDLATFAHMLLNGGELDGRRFVEEETLRAFTRRQSANSTRALGWDTPGPGSSAGAYFTSRSFGHTGFTGTSIWVDPERDVFVILLANRVNPTRENRKIFGLRQAVADAVQQAITDVPVSRRAPRSSEVP